jgi:hypothetical protein
MSLSVTIEAVCLASMTMDLASSVKEEPSYSPVLVFAQPSIKMPYAFPLPLTA